MEGIWYDSRKTDGLRDEAPSAYKDIRAVLRAQKDMVKVTRTLRPVLNYKELVSRSVYYGLISHIIAN